MSTYTTVDAIARRLQGRLKVVSTLSPTTTPNYNTQQVVDPLLIQDVLEQVENDLDLTLAQIVKGPGVVWDSAKKKLTFGYDAVLRPAFTGNAWQRMSSGALDGLLLAGGTRTGGLFGMRSLNSMMAEFRRGKDKKKRKSRTLSGSVGKGAVIGMGVPLALGTLAGATGAGIYAVKTGMKPGMVALSVPVGGLGGLTATASKAPGKVLAAGALGGGIGAGLYGVDRLKNRNKKQSLVSRLAKR